MMAVGTATTSDVQMVVEWSRKLHVFFAERISAPDRWRERAFGAELGLEVGILAFQR